ncbi:MAG: rRNA maturation RNase YbeY [Chloroflexota bacterium]
MKPPRLPRTDRLSLFIEIRPRTTTAPLRALIRAVSRATLGQTSFRGRARLSVHLVDDSAIHRMNAEHRGVDAPTDVLSFPQLEDSGFVIPPGEAQHVGDVVVSLDRAEAQAQEYGHSLEREIGYLTAHGILHCLGYDHETADEQAVMRKHEESVMTAVGLTR